MRILYIYKDYMKRRKAYGKIMERYGHEIVYFEIWKKHKKNKIRPEDIKKYNADVVWFFNPIYIRNNPIAIEFIKKSKTPIIMYNTYLPSEPYYQSMDIWSKIDFLFVHNLEFHKFLKKKNLNSYYMPIGFYPSQYYKSMGTVAKKYDVSFCGTALPRDDKKNDKRAKYLRSLSNKNIIVLGESYSKKVGDIPVKSYKEHKEQLQVYWQTKINLDLPFFHSQPSFYKNKYHIKNRFFEIPASHSFLLTVRCDEFLKIFGEDVVGYYDDNIESLKETVNRYLKDDRERNKMVEYAYRIVHQKHSYSCRFKEMFKIIDSA